MAVTLADVAARAGVSAATVSRVLSGNYPVAGATRSRVLRAVDELEYVVNGPASALAAASSDLVGILVNDIADPFFGIIAGAVQSEMGGAEGPAGARKLAVVCNTGGSPEQELTYLTLLQRQRAAALVLTGGAVENSEHSAALAARLRRLAASGTRVVLCGRPPLPPAPEDEEASLMLPAGGDPDESPAAPGPSATARPGARIRPAPGTRGTPAQGPRPTTAAEASAAAGQTADDAHGTALPRQGAENCGQMAATSAPGHAAEASARTAVHASATAEGRRQPPADDQAPGDIQASADGPAPVGGPASAGGPASVGDPGSADNSVTADAGRASAPGPGSPGAAAATARAAEAEPPTDAPENAAEHAWAAEAAGDVAAEPGRTTAGPDRAAPRGPATSAPGRATAARRPSATAGQAAGGDGARRRGLWLPPDGADAGPGVLTVAFDNRGGAHRLTAHLLDLGHRAIGYVAGPADRTTTRHRLEGHRTALAAYDPALAADAERLTVHGGAYDRSSGYDGALELLRRAPEVTAMVAANDTVALGICAALRDRGLRIPQDISVAGFDDLPFSADAAPPLTTVRLPLHEAGARAGRLALCREVPPPGGVATVRADLMVRPSTAPPRTGR